MQRLPTPEVTESTVGPIANAAIIGLRRVTSVRGFITVAAITVALGTCGCRQDRQPVEDGVLESMSAITGESYTKHFHLGKSRFQSR